MSRCKELFARAAELDPEARAALLTVACRDEPDLREELECLLTALDRAGDFLETPAVDWSQVPTSRQQDRAGFRIGRYLLEEKVGEGGMGVVWRAEQVEPVHRRVALKLLKPGTESRQVLRRFEDERRALERMDHPNIARVLDAGMTDGGRPFVVMELVRGAAITTFCDARRLTVFDRLRLFIPVCRAVQHAHAKGIIHRDLKPSNILVADDGDSLIPKVIDFGIARSVDRPVDETYHTRNLVLLGTPSYVSPEQALKDSDVDTRTDVYSLGAVLYELMCGVPPFDPQGLTKLPADELLRRIRFEEPARLSRRLDAMSQPAAIAEARDTTAAGLRRQLCGDLDRIVMKAIEKNPADRYETVAALADDIERLLRHEPVAATRPSAAYHALKFARRHRTGLVAGSLIMASLLAGTGVSTWQTVRAQRAEADTAAALRKEQRAHLLAATNERKYRHQAYLSDVNLADEAGRHDDTRRMKQLLELHHPELGAADSSGFEWHFLWKQCTAPGGPVDTIVGGAYFACFSPDQSVVAACGADGTIRIYDPATWKRLTKIDAGQGDVNGLAYSPDGGTLASTGEDGTVKLWHTADWTARRSIPVFEGQAYQAAFALVEGELLLAVCGEDSAVKLFDPATGARRGKLEGHGRPVEAIAASQDGRLAAASEDGIPRLWDLASRSLIGGGPRLADGQLVSVAFSHDGRFVAFGTSSPDYLLWDTASDSLPQAHPVNASRPREGEGAQSIAFSSDDSTIILADRGGVIRYRSLHSAGAATRPGEFQWVAHDDRVQALALSSDGEQVVTASRNGELSVWRRQAIPHTRTVDAGVGRVADVAAGRGHAVAIAGENGLCLWLFAKDDAGRIVIDRGRSATVIDQSRDGRYVAAGDGSGRLALWEPGAQGFVLRWERPSRDGSSVQRLRISPDARYVAALVSPQSTPSKEVRLLDGKDGRTLARLAVPGAFGLDFSPDGRTVAVDRESDVLLLDVPAFSIRKVLVGHHQSVRAIAFDPQGDLLATGGNDRWITFWDTSTGQMLDRWVAHGSGVLSIDFDPEGRRLLSTGGDGTPKLWDVATGRLLLRLQQLDEDHSPALFAGGGQIIVARNQGDGLILFDARGISRLAANDRQRLTGGE